MTLLAASGVACRLAPRFGFDADRPVNLGAFESGVLAADGDPPTIAVA